MQDIILQQKDAAHPMTGKGFVLRIAGILLRLALAQIIVNLLIVASGWGLLNIAFYGYAVWLLVAFMRSTVAGYVYTLKADALMLERRLGDSTTTLVRIPLDRVVSMRAVHMAENLKITYKQVTHIDPASRPSARARAAFALSLISARLARWAAGARAQEVIGHVLVYDEGETRCACTFCPNAQMQAALADALGERCGFDERMTRARAHSLYARALERAFPALYPFVDPLVKPEDVAWARDEMERQKGEKKAKKEQQKPKSAKRGGKKNGAEKDAGNPDAGAPGDGVPGDGVPGDGMPGDGMPGDAAVNAPRRRRKQG